MSSIVSRRDFLKGLAAGGLLLGLGLLGCKSEETSTTSYNVEEHLKGDSPDDPNTWLAIAPDGTVHIVVARSEMGQGAKSTLALAIADELDADRSRVKIIQAIGDEKRYGSQNTDGSTSIRDHLAVVRRAGATAREMLRSAAAADWGVPADEIVVRNHEVLHEKSGRKADFGKLAAAASQQPVPTNVEVKNRKDLRYLGTDALVGFDTADIVNGRAQFGADVYVPGMKHAVILRPPVYGGTVGQIDDKAAIAVPGVERIVRLPDVKLPAGFTPLGGVAVIATNTWAAMQGRDKLKVSWNDGPNKNYDSDAYRRQLEQTVSRPATVVDNRGDVAHAQSQAKKVVKADYYLPHLAHAPMEPPVAVASVKDGKCEIWAPTQNPQATREEVAKALKMPIENVTCHVTLLGGGFGRKSKPDYIVEAALLSQEVEAPVKVQWTREDEIRHGYYHAVSAHHLEASLDGKNKVTSWLHRTAFPSIGSLSVPDVHHGLEFEFGMGFRDLPFDLANIRLENGNADPHVRIGWFRSVANIYHAYAIQSFIHEIAQAAGRDHREVLLEMIGPARQFPIPHWNYGRSEKEHPMDTGRLRKVIEVATEKAGWGRKLPAGRALGLAAHRSFLTYVATVVEVEVGPNGKLTIPQVHTAVDCGFAVNPDRVRSQIEGAAVMGTSLALFGNLTFKNGRAQQSNFDDFPVARMPEAPKKVDVTIVNTGDALGGIGEPGLPVFAPALCNAITTATGKRFHALPIANQLGGKA